MAVFFGLMVSNAAFAEEEKSPEWNEETLSGNWGGLRHSLYEKGVTVELTHKSDLLANISGGASHGSAWLANSEIAVNMDMDKLAGWNATTAFFQYHIQHGAKSIDNYTGSFAGVDNIESDTNAGQFFQAWLQKNSANDSLSVLAGLYAIDSEFHVTDTSGLFLQPPYGMSAEMAQARPNGNGPPVFPMGALGVRVKYSGSDCYLQAALTDGVPGNPNNPQGTQIRLDNGDGTLAVVEIGFTPRVKKGHYNKTALGLWRYTARANDLADFNALGNPLRRIDRGAYILAERTLSAEQNDSTQGLSGFIRFGVANKDIHQVDWSASLGLNYQGLIDGRDNDKAGIATTASHASNKYRMLNAGESSETVIEMTYRAQLQSWLAVQPLLQYIFNPNMNAALQDAWVTGVRLEVAF